MRTECTQWLYPLGDIAILITDLSTLWYCSATCYIARGHNQIHNISNLSTLWYCSAACYIAGGHNQIHNNKNLSTLWYCSTTYYIAGGHNQIHNINNLSTLWYCRATCYITGGHNQILNNNEALCAPHKTVHNKQCWAVITIWMPLHPLWPLHHLQTILGEHMSRFRWPGGHPRGWVNPNFVSL